MKYVNYLILCALFVFSACKQKGAEPQGENKKAPKTQGTSTGINVKTSGEASEQKSPKVKSRKVSDTLSSATLNKEATERMALKGDTVSVMAFSGVKVGRGSLNGEFVNQLKKPVYISVYRGPNQAYAKWKDGIVKRQGASLEGEEKVTVCGVEGTKAVAHFESVSHPAGFRHPDRKDEGAEAPAPRIYTKPAATVTVLGFEKDGVPVMVGYRIRTRDRASYKDLEDKYFASVKCGGAEKAAAAPPAAPPAAAAPVAP